MSSHGGQLLRAADEFQIPVGNWIDLSTAISPLSWPAPSVPTGVLRHLPDRYDALCSEAANYYGCAADSVLPVPGSQTAINLLPKIARKGDGLASVAIPTVGYLSHKQAWERAGFHVVTYRTTQHLIQLLQTTVICNVLVINPNNPSTELIDRDQLQVVQRIVQQRNGLLCIDEAFMDCTPEYSMANAVAQGNLVILRSVGKFFGLAGIRLGFCLSNRDYVSRLSSHLPDWSVSNVAQWIGQQALADSSWRANQQAALAQLSKSWLGELRSRFKNLDYRCHPLFITGFGDADYCNHLFSLLGNLGILIRLFEASSEGCNAVRFGIPDRQQLQEIQHRINNDETK